MAERMKGLLPLAAAVGILAFLWTWVALNFSFHWVTDGDLGNGLDLPSNFQLMVPAAFVSWAMYFAAGGDNAAARKVAIANVFGAVAALVVDVALAGDRGPPGLLGDRARRGRAGGGPRHVRRRSATGSSSPAPSAPSRPCSSGGSRPGSTTGRREAAAWGTASRRSPHPATAGAGAFGGVISTPYGWVFVSVLVTLTLGVGLGMLSTRLAALLTPKPRAAATEAPPRGSAVA